MFAQNSPLISFRTLHYIFGSASCFNSWFLTLSFLYLSEASHFLLNPSRHLLHIYSILQETFVGVRQVVGPGFKMNLSLREMHCLRYSWHWNTRFCFMQCFVAVKCNGFNPYHIWRGRNTNLVFKVSFYLCRDLFRAKFMYVVRLHLAFWGRQIECWIIILNL